MPAKTSKEVTDRQKSCQFLLTALRQQGAWVAESLLELVRPHLPEGDQEPDFYTPIVALAHLLEASMVSLVAADEKVYAANVRLGRLRQRRDEVFSRLARKIARLRLTLTNQFVAPRLDDLGFEQETARSPTPLTRQADRIGTAFGDDDLAVLLGEGFFEHRVDLRPQVAELPPLAKDLRRTLTRIDETRRAFDEAKVGKDRTMKSHDQLFLRNARSFEESCRMVGADELADRVRASEKRVGRADKPPEEATEDKANDDKANDDEATGDEATAPPVSR